MYWLDSYQANTGDGGQATFYVLSFSMLFGTPRDTYLIAHSFPYTYTDLKKDIASLVNAPQVSSTHTTRSSYPRRNSAYHSAYVVDLIRASAMFARKSCVAVLPGTTVICWPSRTFLPIMILATLIIRWLLRNRSIFCNCLSVIR